MGWCPAICCSLFMLLQCSSMQKRLSIPFKHSVPHLTEWSKSFCVTFTHALLPFVCFGIIHNFKAWFCMVLLTWTPPTHSYALITANNLISMIIFHLHPSRTPTLPPHLPTCPSIPSLLTGGWCCWHGLHEAPLQQSGWHVMVALVCSVPLPSLLTDADQTGACPH